MNGKAGKVRIKKDLDASKLEKNLVVSTAPAVGLPDETLPFFALSYALGNVLASFAEPEFVTDTITVPPQSCGSAIGLYRILEETARRFGVEVSGGHTGCYEGVELPLITVTAYGKMVKTPIKPSDGDSVILVGEPALESGWLRWLAGLSEHKVEWNQLTPVPALRDMLKINGIKLAHDVSEGGIGGALVELQERYGLNVTLTDMELFSMLSEPSYGTVLAVTNGEQEVCQELNELGHKCKSIAVLGGSQPLVKYRESDAWAIYGKPACTFDRTANRFSLFLKQLSEIDIKDLVPEVGMNVAYSENASDIGSVIGVDGRIVKCLNGVRFGSPAYGASRHVGYMLLELKKLGAKYRVAANIRLSDKITDTLRKMNMKIQEVNVEDLYCPPLRMIRETGIIADAYIEKPSVGLEGGVVLLSEDLDKMRDIIEKLCA